MCDKIFFFNFAIEIQDKSTFLKLVFYITLKILNDTKGQPTTGCYEYW